MAINLDTYFNSSVNEVGILGLNWVNTLAADHLAPWITRSRPCRLTLDKNVYYRQGPAHDKTSSSQLKS